MSDFFYSILIDDVNTITYYSLTEFIETCKENINYIEYFPISVQNNLYVDSYYSTYDLKEINGFRNYWQYRLFSRSLINFNYNWLWSFIHIDESYWTSHILYDNFLGSYDQSNELLYKMKRFYLTRKSIWDNTLVSERSLKQYSYVMDHILTSNFYLQNLSGKSYKNGFYLYYYEHFYSVEILIQAAFSYFIEFNMPIIQNRMATDTQLLFKSLDFRSFGTYREYFRIFRVFDKIDYINFNDWSNFEGFRLIKNNKSPKTNFQNY